MTNFFAVKGPDGEWYCPAGSEGLAWDRAFCYDNDDINQAKKTGYRCVEVRLVEVTDAPAHRDTEESGDANV